MGTVAEGNGETADAVAFYESNSAFISDMGLYGVTEHSYEVLFFITLVRTIPGLWSRMCSRVAAISISLTPEVKQKEKLY